MATISKPPVKPASQPTGDAAEIAALIKSRPAPSNKKIADNPKAALKVIAQRLALAKSRGAGPLEKAIGVAVKDAERWGLDLTADSLKKAVG